MAIPWLLGVSAVPSAMNNVRPGQAMGSGSATVMQNATVSCLPRDPGWWRRAVRATTLQLNGHAQRNLEGSLVGLGPSRQCDACVQREPVFRVVTMYMSACEYDSDGREWDNPRPLRSPELTTMPKPRDWSVGGFASVAELTGRRS